MENDFAIQEKHEYSTKAVSYQDGKQEPSFWQ